MKVLFHTNTLNYRGTTVAVADYAKYNQDILGNESIIAYCKTNGTEKDMGNENIVIGDLKKKFNVVGYRSGDLEKKIDDLNIDIAYFINSGKKEVLPTNCKTAVHAVFQFNEPHGDRYGYISDWLSSKMSQSKIHFVPHIVSLPAPNKNYREAFGITEDQIVIGRLGGYFTFDIPFVKKAVEKIVLTDKRFVFLFVGTEPFVKHPNVHYINETCDSQKKSNFINTCDAMLHARHRGESFGLSVAEFLSQNKPVLAWNDGYDLNHLQMLEGSNTLYSEKDFVDKLINIKDLDTQNWVERTINYSPEVVMNKFKEVFLS